MRRSLLLGLGIAAATLAACGGGGGSQAVPSVLSNPAAGSPSTSSGQRANASVKIAIPARSTSAGTRSPRYISASTQSMVFSIVDPTTHAATQLASFDLTPTSPGCSAVPGGGTQCVETLGAPQGTDTFQVVAYDQTGGKGNTLSTATVQASLTAGAANSIPLVMDGVAATAQVVVGTGSFPVGTASSTLVSVQAKDAQGNTIVGPGAFAAPFSLTLGNDTWSSLKLSQTTLSKPGEFATLSYNGNSLAGAQLNAIAGGVTVTPATVAGAGYAITSVGIDGLFQTSSCANNSAYPEDIAALPGGGAAFTYAASWYYYGSSYGCSGNTGSDSWSSLGVMSPGGQVTLYRGDIVDPLASPAPQATSFPTAPPNNSFNTPPVTVVHGMSANLETEPGEGYSEIAAAPLGNPNVYYGSDFGHLTANGDWEYYGVIGAFNPTSVTTKETIVKGEPYQIRTLPNGSVVFTEDSGTVCPTAGTCAPSLSSDGSSHEYGIGMLNADGTIAFEKSFSQLGLPIGDGTYPADMNVSPDGSQLYVADSNNNRIVSYPISGTSLGAPSTAKLAIAKYLQAVAASNDGAFWATDYKPNQHYYFGAAPKASFADASVKEFAFTTSLNMYSYSAVYADGSFWAADEDYAGVGRFPAGNPALGQEYIQTSPQPNADSLDNCGISAGNGAIYAAECSYGSIVRIVYGAPQTTGTAPLSIRRTGSVGVMAPSHPKASHARSRKAGAWTHRAP